MAGEGIASVLPGITRQARSSREIVFLASWVHGKRGGQMKKPFEALARLFRWIVTGMISFIIASPTLVSLSADI